MIRIESENVEVTLNLPASGEKKNATFHMTSRLYLPGGGVGTFSSSQYGAEIGRSIHGTGTQGGIVMICNPVLIVRLS